MDFRIREIKEICEEMIKEGFEFCEVLEVERDENEINEETGEPEKGCLIFSGIEAEGYGAHLIGGVDEVSQEEIQESVTLSPLETLFINIEGEILEQKLESMENPFIEPNEE